MQTLASDPEKDVLIVSLWNECLEHQLFFATNRIFKNTPDELDDELFNERPSVILNAATKGCWKAEDRWAIYDSDNELLKSYASASDFINVDLLANWLQTHPDKAEDLEFLREEDPMPPIDEQLKAILSDPEQNAHAVELWNDYAMQRLPSSEAALIYENNSETLECFFEGRENLEELKAKATGWKAEDPWVKFNEETGEMVSTNNLLDFIDFEGFTHWCALHPNDSALMGVTVTDDEFTSAREREIRSWTAKK